MGVSQWLADPTHLYIGRRMRIFIHTKIKTNEAPGTKVAKNADDDEKTLIRPESSSESEEKASPFDPQLLAFPAGSYVSKKGEIVHMCMIPQSPFHNPFKAQKKVNSRGQIVDEFEEYMKENTSMRECLRELKDYTEIGCWCAPKQCHGDVILREFSKLQKRSKASKDNIAPKKVSLKRQRVEREDSNKNKNKKRRIHT